MSDRSDLETIQALRFAGVSDEHLRVLVEQSRDVSAVHALFALLRRTHRLPADALAEVLGLVSEELQQVKAAYIAVMETRAFPVLVVEAEPPTEPRGER